MHADLLVLLSDIDGLYDADPHRDSAAKLIPIVERIDDSIEALAGGAGTPNAKGGMVTKIAAAKIATAQGIDMVILNGQRPDNIYDLLMKGKPVGTRFLAQPKA